MANENRTMPMGRRRNFEKPKDAKATIKKLFSLYLRKYWFRLLIVFIFAVASTIFAIVSPKILVLFSM